MRYVLSVLLLMQGLLLTSWSDGGQDKKPPREVENSIGMKLVGIPAGKFKMGSPRNEKGRKSDEEQRDVEITQAFYLGACEVTQAEFEKVMGFNPSYFSASGKGREGALYLDWSKPGGGKDKVKGLGGTDNFPVENVSWDEAVEFCKKLSALPAEQKAGRRYRLPSEAEWEHACRGGSSSYQVFHFGDSLSSAQANIRGLGPYGGAAKGPWLERTCKVGSYKPNAFGLYDMHGNVWEWCQDWYAKGDEARVRRGGCWIVSGNECRSATRRRRVPDDRRFNLGFRVVLVTADKPTQGTHATPKEEPPASHRPLKLELRATLKGHRQAAMCLAFSPGGTLLASGGAEPTFKVWDLATGKELVTFPPPEEGRFARWVVFSPDGKALAFSWDDGAIQLWDTVKRGGPVVLAKQAFDTPALAFSPDGRTLFCSGKHITLWEVATGKALAVLTGHSRHIKALALSPDGKTLISGSFDKTVRLWDVAARKQRALLERHKRNVWCAAFAPDGKTVASGDVVGVITIWDAAAGRPRATAQGGPKGISALAFSPDGKILASTDRDGVLRLWDPATGKERVALKVSGGAAFGVTFAPDGKTLATGSGDGTIRLWDLAPGPSPNPSSPAKGSVRGAKGRPKVLKELIPGSVRHPGQKRLRITGKVTVDDANTLRFEDGTRVVTSGAIDAPDLDQRALLGDKLYACGLDAANFLEELIGDRPVSFYAFGEGNDRDAVRRLRGGCFVGETNLGAEMVRKGWAISHHSSMTPYEMLARQNKRGLWRGSFLLPEVWRTGVRLPGEPPELEAEQKAFAALKAFVPRAKIGQPGNRVTAIKFTANASKLTDDHLRQLRKFDVLRSVDLHGTAITDAGLDHLAALTDLVELNLNWTKVTPARVVRLVKGRSKFQGLELSGVPFGDSDLADLKGLTGLRSLSLRGSSVTDKGLAHLKSLTKLRVLSLMSTGIGDAGLEHLKGLTDLEDLDLDRTAITDAGLERLKSLRNLRGLQVAFTTVSDAGLEHLRSLSNLKGLNARGTKVTKDGVDKLKQRLPELRVGFGPAPK
jgi:formylglycine-generating enzyme required for sulfatase activity/WD40 repeat protein/endonuclease YncB( thermonuclease family)